MRRNNRRYIYAPSVAFSLEIDIRRNTTVIRIAGILKRIMPSSLATKQQEWREGNEMQRRLAATIIATILLAGHSAYATHEPCPPIPGQGGSIKADTLWLDAGNGYTPNSELEEISRGADNWHWNARWFKLERQANSNAESRNPAWNSARLIINPSTKILTVRLETNPIRTVSGPAIFEGAGGFYYVQSWVTNRLKVCAKLPGFSAP